MKASSTINAGACGFNTKAVADFDEKNGICKLQIDTNCPHFAKVAEILNSSELRPAEEFAWDTSKVHKTMRENCSHTACPVPSGILKAVQVACGKKPPVDASIGVKAL